MNEPPRLLDQDDDALKSLILRSSEFDGPSARSLRRANALALGLASSTVATIGAASTGGGVAAGAAMAGSVSMIKTIAIWVGVGLFSGALVSGTASTLIDAGGQPEASAPQAQTAAAQRAVAPVRPDRSATGPSATVPEPNTIATADGPSAVAAYENTAPAARALPDKRPAASSGAARPAAPLETASPPQGAARFDSTATEAQAVKPSGSPSDELAQELASVDQARSALRSGNAAAALEQVSRYERTYKRPRFAPEASALRIEALIAQGRRSEAAQLARVFMANHPGHPLTLRLRNFLGETP